MSGSLNVKGQSPAGYVTPPFPSLGFHISNNVYTSPLLYYSWDIYRFTVYWYLIFSTGFHVAAAAIGGICSRNLKRTIWTLILYGAVGAFFGFMVGSIVGLILGTVYRAGALNMTPWIPFLWALLTMLFMTLTSYSSMSVFL